MQLTARAVQALELLSFGAFVRFKNVSLFRVDQCDYVKQQLPHEVFCGAEQSDRHGR